MSCQKDGKSPQKGRGFAHVTHFVCATVDLEKKNFATHAASWDQ